MNAKKTMIVAALLISSANVMACESLCPLELLKAGYTNVKKVPVIGCALKANETVLSDSRVQTGAIFAASAAVVLYVE